MMVLLTLAYYYEQMLRRQVAFLSRWNVTTWGTSNREKDGWLNWVILDDGEVRSWYASGGKSSVTPSVGAQALDIKEITQHVGTPERTVRYRQQATNAPCRTTETHHRQQQVSSFSYSHILSHIYAILCCNTGCISANTLSFTLETINRQTCYCSGRDKFLIYQ